MHTMLVIPNTISLLLFAILIGCLCPSEARRFYVGGNDGWTLHPSKNYIRWAERHRFKINDELVFKYKKGHRDSVLVVNRNDYYKCNKENPIKTLKGSGSSTFKLKMSGPFFFISGHDHNCEKGQKLEIVVLSPHHHRPNGTRPIQPPSVAPTIGHSPTPSPSPAVDNPAHAPLSPYPPTITPIQAPSSHSPSPSPVVTTPNNAPPVESPSHSPAATTPTHAPPVESPSHSPSPSPVSKTPTHAPPVEPPSIPLSPSPAANTPANLPSVKPPSSSPSPSPAAKTPTQFPPSHSPSPAAQIPAHAPLVKPPSHSPSPSPAAKTPSHPTGPNRHTPSPSPSPAAKILSRGHN